MPLFPDLFPSWTVLILCGLVVAGSQLIYATVGFGAGMFSIALLALLLPDLSSAVATLMLLTFVTEACVLLRAWRQARGRLLLSLLPTTALGLWLGTDLLVLGNVGWLKRLLGVVVLAAGAWFLHRDRGRIAKARDGAADGSPEQGRAGAAAWTGLPTGLAAGTLAGLFGTGGPPVIVFLHSYRLDKEAFRATLLWYFLLMGVLRMAGYLRVGLLTRAELTAAIWLLPASLLGMGLGMAVHHRMSDRQFGTVVSVLLMMVGGLLLIGGGT